MAELISALDPLIQVEALVASGFDSAVVRIYTEKLISRRDRMIRDLGLDAEIGLLRKNGAKEGTLTMRSAGGNESTTQPHSMENRTTIITKEFYGTPTTH